MKKFVLAAVALSILAGPALADNRRHLYADFNGDYWSCVANSISDFDCIYDWWCGL